MIVVAKQLRKIGGKFRVTVTRSRGHVSCPFVFFGDVLTVELDSSWLTFHTYASGESRALPPLGLRLDRRFTVLSLLPLSWSLTPP